MVRSTASIVVLLLCVAVALAGCNARQVIREPDYGVVAIPMNTNSWPFRYRNKADELMAAHFPEGYEIIREEEMIVGQTTNYEEEQTHGEVEVVKDVVSIGKTETRGSATTKDETEYRIYYQRR